MFGPHRSISAEGYSGSESYRYVEPLIKGPGSSLRITTPYITVNYARMLLGASKRKTVYLLTSNSPGNSESVKMLTKRSRKWGVQLAVWILLLMAAVVMLGLYILIPPLIVVWVTVIVFTIKYSSKHPHLHVKTTQGRLVHEKMYIGTDSAIVGSANLTYSGMYRNVEHLELINDPKRVAELADHFDALWSGY